jgi:hypothetical protein
MATRKEFRKSASHFGKDDDMNTTLSRRRLEAGRGFPSAIALLEVNAELGKATASVDLGEVTDATAPVMAAARRAVDAVLGQVLGERLLGLDLRLANTYLDVAIPRRNRLLVHASLVTEPHRLLLALRSDGLCTLAVDVMVFDSDLAEWAKGRMEWTIRQRVSAEWPVNSP